MNAILKGFLVLCTIAIGCWLVSLGDSRNYDTFGTIIALIGILMVGLSAMYGFIKVLAKFKRNKYQ
jgi:hypothetical protein